MNLTVHFFSPSDNRDLGIVRGEFWFRDVDSNHDTQLQRLMSYRLDDPGTALRSLAEPRNSAQVSLSVGEIHSVLPVAFSSLFSVPSPLFFCLNFSSTSTACARQSPDFRNLAHCFLRLPVRATPPRFC